MATKKWAGTDEEYWHAVAIANDPDADEGECIEAAVILQEVLTLAQDMLTRPETSAELTSSSSQTRAAVAVPPRIIARPKPGEIVTVERAVELFADSWVLKPVAPSKESAMSSLRDYRVAEGQLQYNASYPPQWQESAGTISDCPQWQVICQQEPQQAVDARSSRTSVRTAS